MKYKHKINNFLQFQGIWYEVDAYPKEQQTGQCVYHDYSSGTGNSLSINSSSVTDQFLSISNGLLSFNSTDSSAKLTIRITSNNEGKYFITVINQVMFRCKFSCFYLLGFEYYGQYK